MIAQFSPCVQPVMDAVAYHTLRHIDGVCFKHILYCIAIFVPSKTKFLFDTYNLNRSFQTGFRVLGLNVVVWMNFAGSEGISESATLASLSPFEFWQENGKNDSFHFCKLLIVLQWAYDEKLMTICLPGSYDIFLTLWYPVDKSMLDDLEVLASPAR